jgi:hypothetical protein
MMAMLLARLRLTFLEYVLDPDERGLVSKKELTSQGNKTPTTNPYEHHHRIQSYRR